MQRAVLDALPAVPRLDTEALNTVFVGGALSGTDEATAAALILFTSEGPGCAVCTQVVNTTGSNESGHVASITR